MSDFELGIINAIISNFGEIVAACLFHLRQNAFRRIQHEGLQRQYNDQNDDSIKQATYMMCALAFVPTAEVPRVFDILVDHLPEAFLPVAEWFEVQLKMKRLTFLHAKAILCNFRSITFEEDPPEVVGHELHLAMNLNSGTST